MWELESTLILLISLWKYILNWSFLAQIESKIEPDYYFFIIKESIDCNNPYLYCLEEKEVYKYDK